MAGSDESGYELNEVSWWSNWAETVWLGKDAYLLFSQDFAEYFFNRGGFVRVTGRAAALVDAMEVEFAGRGLTPYIFVQSDSLTPRLLQSFAKKGYRIANQMSVMEADSPSFKVNPELTLELGIDGRVDQWADVYLRAFYGDTKLEEPVLDVLGRLSKNKEAGLLLASLGERPVGALALFQEPGHVRRVLCRYRARCEEGSRRQHYAGLRQPARSQRGEKGDPADHTLGCGGAVLPQAGVQEGVHEGVLRER